MRRRELLGSATAALVVACAPGGGAAAKAALADGPLETTRLRTAKVPSICLAPQYLAEDLLRAEGFTDIQYVNTNTGGNRKLMAAGEIDVSMNFAAPLAIAIDQAEPIAVLAGVHVGCFEVFAASGISSIRDLKGRTIAVPELGTENAFYAFIATVLAHVGLDPRKDVTFVQRDFVQVQEQLQQGKVDAFLGFAPQPQELRAKKIGHVLLNSMVDRPWSHYYCCLVAANKDFAARNPVAAFRATRAILKAVDIITTDPEKAARALVDRKFAANYEYALATMKELPYGSDGGTPTVAGHAGHYVSGLWRDIDPEDTLRFYALRLSEAGSIKGTPDKIIADGLDRRFLDKLRKEPR